MTGDGGEASTEGNVNGGVYGSGCGTCGMEVCDKAVGCDQCDAWFHDSEMCTGLPLDVIKAIERFQGSGIQFICMKCRIDYTAARGNSPSSTTESHMVDLISQLFQQIKGLAANLLEVSNQVKTLTANSQATQPQTDPPPTQLPQTDSVPTPTPANIRSGEAASVPPRPPPLEYRRMVREELRELEEQRKRRSSLVIRGLGAADPRDAVHRFEVVSEFLIDRRVTLTDVVRITSETDLYRGKVVDDTVRKLILDKARGLKQSERFGAVFIRRDLTYKQRIELKARRERSEAHGVHHPSPPDGIANTGVKSVFPTEMNNSATAGAPAGAEAPAPSNNQTHEETTSQPYVSPETSGSVSSAPTSNHAPPAQSN